MAELILYSRQNNPYCELLKGVLREEGIHFTESDIGLPDSVHELNSAGCHALEPPVLKLTEGSKITGFFTNDDLFWDGKIIREIVRDLSHHSTNSA